jgi:hypothetical protein
MSRLQKRVVTSKSKEPRRTHWRTGALNHAIPRGSVWHNVETMGRWPLPVNAVSVGAPQILTVAPAVGAAGILEHR